MAWAIAGILTTMETDMSDIISITADKRERAGKGVARALRREGLVPAVIYGDNKDPEGITLSRKVTNAKPLPAFQNCRLILSGNNCTGKSR